MTIEETPQANVRDQFKVVTHPLGNHRGQGCGTLWRQVGNAFANNFSGRETPQTQTDDRTVCGLIDCRGLLSCGTIVWQGIERVAEAVGNLTVPADVCLGLFGYLVDEVRNDNARFFSRS